MKTNLQTKDSVAYVLTKGFLGLLKVYSEIDIIDVLILSKIYFYNTETKQKKCMLGNEVFSDELGLSERSVTRRIKNLIDLDLLDRKILYGKNYGAVSKYRELCLTDKAMEALRQNVQKREDKNGSSVKTNCVETCSRSWRMSNIYSSKEEYKSSEVSSEDANASCGADAPSLHSQSSNSFNSEFEELSSYLSQYDFENLPNNSLSNIKAWCKQSWEDTSYGDYYEYHFSFDVLSDILTYKSEDLKKTYGKDPSYKFGVLKRILLENYAEFLSKHISRQKEQEEEAIQREADRKTIYYRTDPGAIEAARTRFGTKDDGVLTPEEINAFSLDLEDAM